MTLLYPNHGSQARTVDTGRGKYRHENTSGVSRLQDDNTDMAEIVAPLRKKQLLWLWSDVCTAQVDCVWGVDGCNPTWIYVCSVWVQLETLGWVSHVCACARCSPSSNHAEICPVRKLVLCAMFSRYDAQLMTQNVQERALFLTCVLLLILFLLLSVYTIMTCTRMHKRSCGQTDG